MKEINLIGIMGSFLNFGTTIIVIVLFHKMWRRMNAARSARRYEEWERWMLTSRSYDETALELLGRDGKGYVTTARVMPYEKVLVDVERYNASQAKPSRRAFVEGLAMKYDIDEASARRRLLEVETMMWAGIPPQRGKEVACYDHDDSEHKR